MRMSVLIFAQIFSIQCSRDILLFTVIKNGPSFTHNPNNNKCETWLPVAQKLKDQRRTGAGNIFCCCANILG
jgi:hypothetical protein